MNKNLKSKLTIVTIIVAVVVIFILVFANPFKEVEKIEIGQMEIKSHLTINEKGYIRGKLIPVAGQLQMERHEMVYEYVLDSNLIKGKAVRISEYNKGVKISSEDIPLVPKDVSVDSLKNQQRGVLIIGYGINGGPITVNNYIIKNDNNIIKKINKTVNSKTIHYSFDKQIYSESTSHLVNGGFTGVIPKLGYSDLLGRIYTESLEIDIESIGKSSNSQMDYDEKSTHELKNKTDYLVIFELVDTGNEKSTYLNKGRIIENLANYSREKNGNENFIIDRIGAYYDKTTGKYLISGWWSFKSMDFVNSKSGAMDGAGLAMVQANGQPVTGYILASDPSGIAVYDNKGNYYPDAGGTSGIGKQGIFYTYQDKYHWKLGAQSNYCGYKGQVWFWLDKIPDQKHFYIKMDFEHTWSNAEFISINMEDFNGVPTLKLNFNKPTKNFKKSGYFLVNSWEPL